MNSRKIATYLIAVVAACGACKEKNFGTTSARWVHASPNTPALEVYNSGKLLFGNFNYGDVTEYFTYDRSNLSFQVKYKNEIRTRVSNPVWEEGGRYTVFIVDSFGALNRMLLNDAFISPENGKAQFRFAHLVPDLPAFELLINGSIFPEDKPFAFAQNTAATFYTIDAGSCFFQALVKKNTQTDTISLGSLLLESGKTYTLFATGFAADTATNRLNLGVIIEP